MLCVEWLDSLGASGPEIMTADPQPEMGRRLAVYSVSSRKIIEK